MNNKEALDINETGDVMKLNKPLNSHVSFEVRPKNHKMKKSRRQHSQSFCATTSSNNEVEELTVHSKDDSHKHIYPDRLPFGKNSRKSRNTGKEGKKGFGGKGKWDFRNDVIDDLEIDKKDPCYDSENESVNFEEKALTLSEEKFDEQITNYVKEYFENSEPDDFLQNLSEVTLIPALNIRIPYLCILQAIQRKPAQCELTSRLLTELIGHIITPAEMKQGFDIVITELKELTIDCPEAPNVVGKFIARAIADHLLPSKYVQSYKFSCNNSVDEGKSERIFTGCEEQLRALAKAENLLNLDHAYVRLDTVWGSPGGERPTKMLISKIKMLLQEYLDSGDEKEAERCLGELEAPHFHHEVVFQAILLVIERSTEFVCENMVRLLDCFCGSVIVTIDQLEQGVTRIYNQMSDIVLDVPAAYMILERFINYAQNNASFFSDHLANKMPKNTRPRFVSEGPGFLA